MFGIEEKDWNKDSASELGKHVIELILLVSVCAPRLADLCHLRGQPSRLSGLLPKSNLPETTFMVKPKPTTSLEVYGVRHTNRESAGRAYNLFCRSMGRIMGYTGNTFMFQRLL